MLSVLLAFLSLSRYMFPSPFPWWIPRIQVIFRTNHKYYTSCIYLTSAIRDAFLKANDMRVWHIVCFLKYAICLKYIPAKHWRHSLVRLIDNKLVLLPLACTCCYVGLHWLVLETEMEILVQAISDRICWEWHNDVYPLLKVLLWKRLT